MFFEPTVFLYFSVALMYLHIAACHGVHCTGKIDSNYAMMATLHFGLMLDKIA